MHSIWNLQTQIWFQVFIFHLYVRYIYMPDIHSFPLNGKKDQQVQSMMLKPSTHAAK